MSATAEVVICGAGIAGVAAAYHIAVRRGVGPVVLVDERPPLTLTSDKSAECYRNWWPGPGDQMVAVMNRSIDLLEELARESDNVFRMNRRGYLFATADPDRVAVFVRAAEEAASLGAGAARVHRGTSSGYQPAAAEGFDSPITGADVLADPVLVRRHFPYLAPDTVAVLHARRCGWFSGQQLGMYLLERAREKGVRLVEGRVTEIRARGGRATGVRVETPSAGALDLAAPRVVLAGGPFNRRMAALLGLDLPLYCERHAKIAFEDEAGALPRHAPLAIWADPHRIPWTEAERADLAGSAAHRQLLDELPPGAHARPEGTGDSRWVLGIWTYDVEPLEPTFPLSIYPWYAEIVLRGMARMVPAMGAYLERMPRCVVDGGYYTKTRENRFLAGPLPVEGAYVLGALSGYGLMASNGAADLVADHVAGLRLPRYAPAFSPARYEDPAYLKLLDNWGDTGQL